MKNSIKWLWQTPQNLLGFLLVKCYDAVRWTIIQHKGLELTVYCTHRISGGVSLGKYIIIQDSIVGNTKTQMHEAGHSVQSLYLGWLYLIVIGVPSLLWNRIYYYFCRNEDSISYYYFYTERWADKLGGVVRK